MLSLALLCSHDHITNRLTSKCARQSRCPPSLTASRVYLLSQWRADIDTIALWKVKGLALALALRSRRR
jgi:hypothetical protein